MENGLRKSRSILVTCIGILVSNFIGIHISVAQIGDQRPYVIMVSFDGFRSDYVERWQLPNLKQLIEDGAAVDGLVPSYPSKTFPNHYSIVTGLYPGNHGLVDNTFLNKEKSLVYSMGNRNVVEDPDFYGGLPLWQYAQQNGLKSASYFWVGSEAPIAGSYPDYYEIYNSAVTNDERISQVFRWLELPEQERPQFITLYFSFVDSISHETGPLSFETEQAARQSDKLVGEILDALKESNLPINLIITSDHGMYPVENNLDHVIDLSKFSLDEEKVVIINGQTQAHLYVKNIQNINAIYESLNTNEESYNIYLKEDVPKHWHYSDNENIGDILIVAEPGYVLLRSINEFDIKRNKIIGVHGYDVKDNEELNGIFYAWGPKVQQGIKIKAVENVNIFPFVTELLMLPNLNGIDGDLKNIEAMLK